LNDETTIHPSGLEGGAFRGGIDDALLVPLAVLTLAANRLARFLVSTLVRILDFVFPFAIQIVWLPLLAARLVGDGIIAVLKGLLRVLPLGEATRHRWRDAAGQYWAWLRQRISYRAFEHAVHVLFENGMAWVFRKCRHLTPRAALLCIVGAILWLPISFGAATFLHAILLAKVASWPGWTQLLHPLATVIAKSKLLVLPVYPAAWPQAKKHPFVQSVFAGYEVIETLYLIQKFGFRYRQAACALAAGAARLTHVAGIAQAATWIRRTEESVGREQMMHKPSERLRSFYQRWSIKFSAEYYEAKERESAASRPGAPKQP